MMLFRQLHRIEERHGCARTLARRLDTLGTLRSTNDAAAGRHFRWLGRPPDRLGVFIPVLLGAGVCCRSRVPHRAHRRAVRRGNPRPWNGADARTDLPSASGPLVAQIDPLTSRPVGHRTATATALVVTLLLSRAAVGVLGVDRRPDPGGDGGGHHDGRADIDQQRQDRPTADRRRRSVGAGPAAPRRLWLTAITQLDDEHVQIEIDRSLGSTAVPHRRRYPGPAPRPARGRRAQHRVDTRGWVTGRGQRHMQRRRISTLPPASGWSLTFDRGTPSAGSRKGRSSSIHPPSYVRVRPPPTPARSAEVRAVRVRVTRWSHGEERRVDAEPADWGSISRTSGLGRPLGGTERRAKRVASGRCRARTAGPSGESWPAHRHGSGRGASSNDRGTPGSGDRGVTMGP